MLCFSPTRRECVEIVKKFSKINICRKTPSRILYNISLSKSYQNRMFELYCRILEIKINDFLDFSFLFFFCSTRCDVRHTAAARQLRMRSFVSLVGSKSKIQIFSLLSFLSENNENSAELFIGSFQIFRPQWLQQHRQRFSVQHQLFSYLFNTKVFRMCLKTRRKRVELIFELSSRLDKLKNPKLSLHGLIAQTNKFEDDLKLLLSSDSTQIPPPSSSRVHTILIT